MRRLSIGLRMIYLAAVVIVVLSHVAICQSTSKQIAEKEGLPAASASSVSSLSTPSPKGRSTVMGGKIRDVDPVRDQFTLQVVGGQSIKMLFDERTQVYRDGVKISLLDLRADDHASVETTLDDTKIFALSVHMLSQLPEGELRGLVLSCDHLTGEMTINVALSQKPITLRIPPGTPVVRVGQEALSGKQSDLNDLVRGSLIDVKFKGGNEGHGVATHIDVVAIPGSAFVFSGNVSFLDLHSGRFAVVDPRDNQTYQIAFEPSRFPASRDLHEGLAVKVTTVFDGSRYLASEITIQ
jgi:hypothetical protein